MSDDELLSQIDETFNLDNVEMMLSQEIRRIVTDAERERFERYLRANLRSLAQQYAKYLYNAADGVYCSPQIQTVEP